MPRIPRFGWRVLAASTLLATIAAAGTYVVLDGGEDPGPEEAAAVAELDLTPDAGPADLDTVAFTEFDGTEVSLASLRGTPVLVNFFASTCTPCITEMPAFESVHRALGDRVTFLGLAVADRKDEAQKLVRRTGVTYRTAQDRDGSILNALQGTILPTTVLLGADGEVLATHNGQLDADDLRKMLSDELGIQG